MLIFPIITFHPDASDLDIDHANYFAIAHTFPREIFAGSYVEAQYYMDEPPSFTIGCDNTSKIPKMGEVTFSCRLTPPLEQDSYTVDFFDGTGQSTNAQSLMGAIAVIRMCKMRDTATYLSMGSIEELPLSHRWIGQVSRADTIDLINSEIRVTISQSLLYDRQFNRKVFGGPTVKTSAGPDEQVLVSDSASYSHDDSIKIEQAGPLYDRYADDANNERLSARLRWWLDDLDTNELDYYFQFIYKMPSSITYDATGGFTLRIKDGYHLFPCDEIIPLIDPDKFYYLHHQQDATISGRPLMLPKRFAKCPFVYEDNENVFEGVVDIGGITYGIPANQGIALYYGLARCMYDRGDNSPSNYACYPKWANVGFESNDNSFYYFYTEFYKTFIAIINIVSSYFTWQGGYHFTNPEWYPAGIDDIRCGILLGDESMDAKKALNDFILTASLTMMYFDGKGNSVFDRLAPKFAAEVPPYYNPKTRWAPPGDPTVINSATNGISNGEWRGRFDYIEVTENELLGPVEVKEQRFMSILEYSPRLLWQKSTRDGESRDLVGGTVYDPNVGGMIGKRDLYHPVFELQTYHVWQPPIDYSGTTGTKAIGQRLIPPGGGGWEPNNPNGGGIPIHDYDNIAYWYVGLEAMRRRLYMKAKEVTFKVRLDQMLTKTISTDVLQTTPSLKYFFNPPAYQTVRAYLLVPGEYIGFKLNSPGGISDQIAGQEVIYDNVMIAKSITYNFKNQTATVKGFTVPTKLEDVQGWN